MPKSPPGRLTWSIVERLEPADYRVFRVRQHDAVHPESGARHRFSVIESPNWINVIPLTAADDVVMIRQFRHGIERVTLEIPGGMVDPGESALEAARRELLEETGHRSDTWIHLGHVEPNPAIQNNVCDLFLALDVEPAGGGEADDEELIAVERRPLSAIAGLIRGGEVTHALVVAAFAALVFEAGGWRRPGHPDHRL